MEVQNGWAGRILPFSLVQRAMLPNEMHKVLLMENRLPAISSEMAEILEELSEEEKADAGESINENGDAFVASKLRATIKSLRTDMGPDALAPDSLPSILERVSKLIEEERSTKKELTDRRAALDSNTKEVIEHLNDDQVRQLLSSKWVEPLVSKMLKMPDGALQTFVDKVQALNSKYATTYADIDAQIRQAETELVSMLGNLTGNEYDMAGIQELVVLLGGEA